MILSDIARAETLEEKLSLLALTLDQDNIDQLDKAVDYFGLLMYFIDEEPKESDWLSAKQDPY